MTLKLTREAEGKITRWINAVNGKISAERQLNRAECELKNAEQAIGKLIWPEDGKEHEAFSVWYRDKLVTVSLDNTSASKDYKITIRSKGKSLKDLQNG